MLKADFHIHTKEDPFDNYFINYSAKKMILHAAKKNFDVLSITLHDKLFFNKEIVSFAKKHGILLISGIEKDIRGSHVLILNATQKEVDKVKDLKDLKKLNKKSFVIAAHPYLKIGHSIGDKFHKYHKSFHGVEYNHLHSWFLSKFIEKYIVKNYKAVELSKKYDLPLIGNSDAHLLCEMGNTYTLIDSKKDVDSVISAIKKRKTEIVSNNMPLISFIRRGCVSFFKEYIYGKYIARKPFLQKL